MGPYCADTHYRPLRLLCHHPVKSKAPAGTASRHQWPHAHCQWRCTHKWASLPSCSTSFACSSSHTIIPVSDVNAYRNYGIYVQRQQQQGSSTPCGITPQEALRNISYPEPPPSYEDTMKQSPGIINAVSAQLNFNSHFDVEFLACASFLLVSCWLLSEHSISPLLQSFSSSQENLPPLERQTSNPPPYQPQYIAPEQSGSGQSSGDGTSQKLTGNSSAAENPEAPSIETPASSDQVNVSL